MYIHLGGEKIIRSSELVAIFDISIEKSSKVSKQYVTHAKQEKTAGTHRRRGSKVHSGDQKYRVLLAYFLLHAEKESQNFGLELS